MKADYVAGQNTVISSAQQSDEDKAALRRHVDEIIKGKAFRGSERSISFLKFVVEKAIAGEFDSLKERVIGVELFGRSPSYSTSKDAIVRVTASDVRRRLLQHYGWYGRASKFQISLPIRTYIPEITCQRPPELGFESKDRSASAPHASKSDAAGTSPAGALDEVAGISSESPQNTQSHRIGMRRLILYGSLIAIAAVSLGAIASFYMRTRNSTARSVPHLSLPWSVLFASPQPLRIITSDRDLVEIEALVHKPITVSQYANHIYIPDAEHLTPEIKRLSHDILVSNKAAAVDIPIVVAVTEVAQVNSQKVDVQMAREIEPQDLSNDGNFVFLGSPRSNPWVSLFDDQMDFRFEHDPDSNEFIRNVHPLPNESALMKMDASKTSSYSIIAFLRNPDAHGSVLILSGLDIEGTQAAGRLVSDPIRMSSILHNCGLGDNAASPYFELLIHSQIIAGDSTNTEVVACHRIPGRLDSSH